MHYLKKLIDDYFMLIPLLIFVVFSIRIASLNTTGSNALEHSRAHYTEIDDEIIAETIEEDVVEEIEIIEETVLTEYEFLLLCKCVEAEAGNQSNYGKQLVTDVILNRVDDASYPNDVVSVILQKGQFSVVKNGDINATPTDETTDAVRSQLTVRENYEIIFFNNKGFTKYGKAWKQVEDHFFSTKK